MSDPWGLRKAPSATKYSLHCGREYVPLRASATGPIVRKSGFTVKLLRSEVESIRNCSQERSIGCLITGSVRTKPLFQLRHGAELGASIRSLAWCYLLALKRGGLRPVECCPASDPLEGIGRTRIGPTCGEQRGLLTGAWE